METGDCGWGVGGGAGGLRQRFEAFGWEQYAGRYGYCWSDSGDWDAVEFGVAVDAWYCDAESDADSWWAHAD